MYVYVQYVCVLHVTLELFIPLKGAHRRKKGVPFYECAI